MIESEMVGEIIEIATSLDQGDIRIDEAIVLAENLVSMDRLDPLINQDSMGLMTQDAFKAMANSFLIDTEEAGRVHPHSESVNHIPILHIRNSINEMHNWMLQNYW